MPAAIAAAAAGELLEDVLSHPQIYLSACLSCLQILPAVLAAAAEVESTPIIITSGPSASAKAAKPSGGLFAFGGGARSGGGGGARAASIAGKGFGDAARQCCGSMLS